jgi:energy-coupling factor transporter transmembrane protein EcfT
MTEQKKITDDIIAFMIVIPASIITYFVAWQIIGFFIDVNDPNRLLWTIALSMIVLVLLIFGFFAVTPEENKKRLYARFRGSRRNRYSNERESNDKKFFE